MTNLRLFNDETAYNNATNKEPITISYIKSIDEVKYDQWDNYIEMIYDDDTQVVENFNTLIFPLSVLSGSIETNSIVEVRHNHDNVPLDEIVKSDYYAYEVNGQTFASNLLRQVNTKYEIGKHILHIRISDDAVNNSFDSPAYPNSGPHFSLDGQGDDEALYSNMILNLKNFKCNTISTRAFFHCTNLRKIMLPETLTTLSKSAFEGCSNLNEIYFYSKNMPNIDDLNEFVNNLPSIGNLYLRKYANMDTYHSLINLLMIKGGWTISYDL